jgi:hypothetical protein
MYMIEISDTKVDKMSEYVEDMLWAGGELMHCLEKMKGESGYGEREGYSHEGRSYRKDMMGSRYGMRSRYDNYGYKDDDDWDEDEMMGERRGRRRRDSRGRYM